MAHLATGTLPAESGGGSSVAPPVGPSSSVGAHAHHRLPRAAAHLATGDPPAAGSSLSALAAADTSGSAGA